MNTQKTSPYSYENKHNFSNKLCRLLWRFTYILLFRPSPSFLPGWRRFLLRVFGAKVGRVWFHPTVEIWAPWLLEVGDEVSIDRGVNLYNTFGVKIGSCVVISANSILCTPSHDYNIFNYPLVGGPIVVGDDCWICAEAFILPNITIGVGAVVGARSLVTQNIEPWMVVSGNPAINLKKRELLSNV